nr:MAG TPA: hypothetical protein [Caudoviricetes sp.]
MYLWYTPMKSNHRVLHTSKNLEIPKGRTILNWGRLYNDKPKTTKIQTNVKPMPAIYNHTPYNNNGTYFCSIHNTHKHRLHLYVLKPYISIHMYHAIEHTIVIYNRLQQLRYICCIHNPLYV